MNFKKASWNTKPLVFPRNQYGCVYVLTKSQAKFEDIFTFSLDYETVVLYIYVVIITTELKAIFLFIYRFSCMLKASQHHFAVIDGQHINLMKK